MQIFTIHDSKAQAYLQPFFAPNAAVAIRYVTTAANEAGHEFNVHAEDYTLFQIGEFDTTSSEITPFPNVTITRVIDLLEPSYGTQAEDDAPRAS